MDGSITVPPALGRTELLRGPLRPKLAGLRRTDRRRWPQVDTYLSPEGEAPTGHGYSPTASSAAKRSGFSTFLVRAEGLEPPTPSL